jgi:hypothetical protein
VELAANGEYRAHNNLALVLPRWLNRRPRRMKSKSIEAFVRRSIKQDTDVPDAAELQRLLDQMSTTEMQAFWTRFAVDRAFSIGNAAVPDWKTKEQHARVQYEHMSYAFWPTAKDSTGNYVIIRKDLEQHVKTHLLKHIQQECQEKQLYDTLPLYVRLHDKVGLAAVFLVFSAIPIGICLLIADGLFHINLLAAVASPARFVFTIIWALYLLMALARPLFRKKSDCVSELGSRQSAAATSDKRTILRWSRRF